MVTLALRLDRNSNIHCAANASTSWASPFATGRPQRHHALQCQHPHRPVPGFPRCRGGGALASRWIGLSVTKSPCCAGIWNVHRPLSGPDRGPLHYQLLLEWRLHYGRRLGCSEQSEQLFAIVANSSYAFQSGFATGATLAQLQAAVPGFNQPNFNTIANEIKNPKFYEWNFEVQHSFGQQVCSR